MTERPKTLFWFQLYVVLQATLYLCLVGAGIAFLIIPAEELEMSMGQDILVGWVFILLGIMFFLFVIPALFLPRRGGAWIYGLAVIILGLTSVVLFPLCLPLLVCWFRDPVKDWFVPIAP